MGRPNQSAAANGLSAVRSSVAGIRERTMRSTAAPEAVAELDRSAVERISKSLTLSTTQRVLLSPVLIQDALLAIKVSWNLHAYPICQGSLPGCRSLPLRHGTQRCQEL